VREQREISMAETVVDSLILDLLEWISRAIEATRKYWTRGVHPARDFRSGRKRMNVGLSRKKK
jgi:hypothetical protein